MDADDQSEFRHALLNCLILLSAGAAAIHFAAISDHFEEDWAYGMFFAIAAWLQLLWAIAMAASRSRRLVAASVPGNAAIIAIWIVSRTSGLPVGPHAGTAEPITFIDTLATSFEAFIVAGSCVALRRAGVKTSGGARARTAATAATALIVVSLTTVAIASESTPKERDIIHGGSHHQFQHG